MSLIGNNLLSLAMSVQPKQAAVWHQFTGRTTNTIGYDVPTFAAPATLYGSWQPMSKETAQRLGFDIQESYAYFYASAPVNTAGRDMQGDEFTFDGSRWKAYGTVDWMALDSWSEILLVRIGPDAG